MKYKINGKLTAASQKDGTELPVETMSRNEFEKKYHYLEKNPILRRSMRIIKYCRADIFKDYLFGTVCIPPREEKNGEEKRFAYYMDRDRLIFIGNTEYLDAMLHDLKNYQITDMEKPAHVLFEVLAGLIADDVEYIDDYESRLENKENEMAEGVNQVPKDFEQYVMNTRRSLMGLSRYYKQMAEMGLVLADCPNQLIDGSTMDIFRMFADKASRLSADVQYLKEYTLQIKDMYQARIDVHQNRVMQFLTIVTTIFMPLTLITGWYGMNFAKMPELSWEFGYAMVIFLAVIIIVIEILIFKKKRWL